MFEKILKLAPKFEAKDTAPSTFSDLFKPCPKLVVWAGASENTIYGDARVNWTFRAWYDSLHIKLGADFSLEGEIRVAIEQCRLIDSDFLAQLILAEVIGQAEYFFTHNSFPENQREFILSYLKLSPMSKSYSSVKKYA